MGVGGRRAGAGRKAGSGWHPESRTIRAAARDKIVQLVGSSADPLSFVCDLANDPSQDIELRLSAASIALPYLHPRLSAMASVSATVPKGSDPQQVLETVLGRIARLAPPTIEGEVQPQPQPETAGS